MDKTDAVGSACWLVKRPLLLATATLVAMTLMAAAPVHAEWQADLEQRLEEIDESYPGELGVYVRDVENGDSVTLRDDESWYLASMVKVPVAITVLEQVDDGKLALDERIELKPDDFVDGAGETNWKSPGDQVTVRYLIEQMLTHSDNTATDVLIRVVGLDRVNGILQRLSNGGVGDITRLADVRRYAYRNFHEGAMNLTSRDFFTLKKAQGERGRVDALAKLLGVNVSEFQVTSLDDAFERYYASERNSGQLGSFAEVWVALAEGRVLEKESREYLLSTLETIRTGDNRIKAGLPEHVSFAHKTGTQHRRACNLGLASASHGEEVRRVVIGVCARGSSDLQASEKAMRQVGRAVAGSGVLGSDTPSER